MQGKALSAVENGLYMAVTAVVDVHKVHHAFLLTQNIIKSQCLHNVRSLTKIIATRSTHLPPKFATKQPLTMLGITASPIRSSDPEFGATLDNVNIENLSDADFAAIWDALYQYNVVHIKSTPDVSPKAQAELTRRFDPSAQSYGHGKTLDAKRSILHPDLKTVPHQPEVQVIGHGSIPEYQGLKDIKLKHPHHKTFHKTVIPDADDHDFTRFYRWHIDAALFGALNPPLVISLLAVQLPSPRTQTLRYDDGTSDTMQVPLGTTSFVSGYKMFDLLSPAQKEFALTSKIEYAAHCLKADSQHLCKRYTKRGISLCRPVWWPPQIVGH